MHWLKVHLTNDWIKTHLSKIAKNAPAHDMPRYSTSLSPRFKAFSNYIVTLKMTLCCENNSNSILHGFIVKQNQLKKKWNNVHGESIHSNTIKEAINTFLTPSDHPQSFSLDIVVVCFLKDQLSGKNHNTITKRLHTVYDTYILIFILESFVTKHSVQQLMNYWPSSVYLTKWK